MKYAIISDIHGNNVALQNVLKDAEENQADAFIFVGDYCVSAPWPREVVETLQNMKHAFIVSGNEEQYLHTPEGDDGQFEISRWSKHQLSAEQIGWLDNFPERLDMFILIRARAVFRWTVKSLVHRTRCLPLMKITSACKSAE